MNGPRTGEEAATAKVVAYAALTGIGLLAAVVFGDVAVVGLAAPFAFALAAGLLSPVPPLPRVSLSLDQRRLLEGEGATITIWLSAPGRVPQCNVGLGVPGGLSAQGPTEWSLRLNAEIPGVHRRCRSPPIRYGRFRLSGPVTITVSGAVRASPLPASRHRRRRGPDLEVLPKAEALRTLARAHEQSASYGRRQAGTPAW